ncbi:MAG: hypothetical protein Q7S22_00830 [Candidatus Micrarchaeota archaeon]|nr:hypothetical protein [Candidatus Micrarchaeota archaeon]
MNVNLSHNISLQVQEMAKGAGLKEDEIVNNAVVLYLDTMKKHMQLKKELTELDDLSDEALSNFEAQL